MKTLFAAMLLLLAVPAFAQAPKKASKPAIRIDNFNLDTEDTAGDFHQAGCLFNRPSVTGPEIVFAYSQQGLIKINGKTRLLKTLPSRNETSLDQLIFGDADYKVYIHTKTGHSSSSGPRKGTLRVYHIKSGRQVLIKVEGICGS